MNKSQLSSGDWSQGYAASVDYMHEYVRDIAPVHLHYALTARQQRASVGRPMRYLELGFGQGLSLNIHAAANEGEFWGIDVMPSQTANARDFATSFETLGHATPVRVFDDGFAEFLRRDDVPMFDVITAHGVWSWVSEANRQLMVDVLAQKLLPGGAVYMSYNVLPGWSAMVPIQKLLQRHAQSQSPAGSPMPDKVNSALGFMRTLGGVNARYLQAHPVVMENIGRMGQAISAYVAHEYFGDHWQPMMFADIADAMTPAKLSFACSAHLPEHVDEVNVSADQGALLATLADAAMRETVRDFCTNQQFRKDIWVKGLRPLTPIEQFQAVRVMRFALMTRPADVTGHVGGSMGSAGIFEPLLQGLLSAFTRKDLAPLSLEEIGALLPQLQLPEIFRGLTLLAAAGHVQPAHGPATTRNVQARCAALNEAILLQALSHDGIGHLASPVTGGGVAVNRIEQLFLRALRAGHSTATDLAQEAWRVVAANGQKLRLDGKSMKTPDENIAELTRRATEFLTKRLAVLRALMVA
jgi:hypothetical protein